MHTVCMFLGLAFASHSHAAALSPLSPDGDCFRPALSGDGRLVVFDSMATNLHPGDTDSLFDIYLFDASTREITLVSASASGQSGNGPSTHAGISGDGRWIVFASFATDLGAGHPTDDSGERSRLFLFDRSSNTSVALPIAGPDVDPNGDSRCPRISADGRFVVFESLASNLVPDDTNAANDVFVHEIATGRTERVSTSSGGGECLLGGSEGSISHDGRLIAFTSLSDDVAPGDSNGYQDVFLHDRTTSQTTIISVSHDVTAASGSSYSPAIAGDGSSLLFESTAVDLTEEPLPLGPHIFRADLNTGRITCLSVDGQGRPGVGHSQYPTVSADGVVAAFASTAESLASTPLQNRLAIFLCPRPGVAPQLFSRDSSGTPGTKDSDYPCLSADGRWLAYSTKCSGLAGQSLTSATVVIVEIASGRVLVASPEATPR